MFLDEINTNVIFKHYYRYLDDIIIFWNLGEQNAKSFIEIINGINQCFRFTHEINIDEATFLDIKLRRGNGNKILTDVYRKPTDSGL